MVKRLDFASLLGPAGLIMSTYGSFALAPLSKRHHSVVDVTNVKSESAPVSNLGMAIHPTIAIQHKMLLLDVPLELLRTTLGEAMLVRTVARALRL
jgi:hypothetical protein